MPNKTVCVNLCSVDGSAFTGIKGRNIKRESIGKKEISLLFILTYPAELQKTLSKGLQTELFREFSG